MNLYHKLNDDENFLDYFCDVLESTISSKTGNSVNVKFKKSDISIFFFIDSSSILQISPDKELEYTYAHIPSYEMEIQSAISSIEIQYHREEKINKIIKKELN